MDEYKIRKAFPSDPLQVGEKQQKSVQMTDCRRVKSP